MTSDLLSALLEKRGITGDAVEKFLNPDFERDTYPPELLHDMEKAVVRILAAMAQGEKIAVYSDFDCDGIPGAAVLASFFEKIEYPVEIYIPHRDREGYGFHRGAIESLKAKGVSLIVTVDVGIAAVEQVAYAQKAGIDVIVTDHHEVLEVIPPAYAVINPKLGTYPFPSLCGAAVAWKLACALLNEGRKRALPNFLAIPEGWEKWLLDLVAIATIADMVPLIDENRALAHFGLKVLRKSPRPGIRALCTKARITQASITEDDIGFTIAPRINAASRMDEPEIAFRLLSTRDPDEATACAAKLESLNSKRKGVVGAIVREAKSRVRARFSEADTVVVLGDTDWKPALLGLASNSIVGDRGGVACLWGRDAHGNLKGSCRSDGSLSVVALFQKAGDALLEYGGHAASGGFSVSHEAVHTLPDILAEAARSLEVKSQGDEAVPDADLRLREVSMELWRELSALSPFGIGNPKPLFRVRDTRISFARQFGKEQNHLEVTLVCSHSGMTCRAFQYFVGPLDFTVPPSPGNAADVLATIERDTFRGPAKIVLRLSDIIPVRS